MERRFTPFRETKFLKSINPPPSPPFIKVGTPRNRGGMGDDVEIAMVMALIAALLGILLLGGQDKTASIESKTT